MDLNIAIRTSQLPDAGRLRKQILKLRWIGLDDEADRLAQDLARQGSEIILIEERQTD